MATPRKHWFRVADSVAMEAWSNDVAATFMRLGAVLNTRWARDGRSPAEACSITLRSADLQALTGSGSLARARRIVHELATHVSLTVDGQGTNTTLEWPKFAEFQRYESRPGVQPETLTPSAMPPPQDAPARRKTPPKKKEPAPSEPSVCRSCGCSHPKRKHRMPGLLSAEQVSQLSRYMRENGHGPENLERALETVREWADAKGATNLCWVRAIQGYIRDGWALRGVNGSTGNRGKSPQPARPTPLVFGSREWCAAQSPPVDYDERQRAQERLDA